nr:MAG TPA: hypothetical protein [Caudoviricetes sp.]
MHINLTSTFVILILVCYIVDNVSSSLNSHNATLFKYVVSDAVSLYTGNVPNNTYPLFGII